VSWWRSRFASRSEAAGIGALRRLLLYGLLLAAVMVATTGVAMLVGEAIDAARDTRVGPDENATLALALALAVVGVPTTAALWIVAQRITRADLAETRTQLRRLYLVATRMVALVVILGAGVAALPELLRVDLASSRPWGSLLVWTLLWVGHERIALGERASTTGLDELERLYRYAAAALALAFLGIGGVFAVGGVVESAYHAWFLDGVRGFEGWQWSEASRIGTTAALMGGLAWRYHWRRVSNDRPSLLWRVTVFLVVMPAAIGAVLATLGSALDIALTWLFEGADRSAAAVELEPLAMLITAATVGLVIWAYHSNQLVRGPAGLSEPERIYRYLAAAAGLVTLVAGLAALLTLPLEMLASAGDGGGDGELISADRAALVLSLIGVGGATWLRYWFGLRRAVAAHAVAEREAISRRVYVSGVFGVAGALMLTTMAIVLFLVFDAALDRDLTRDIFREIRWPFGFLVSSTIAAVYHWTVVVADRRALPAVLPAAPPTERPAGPASILLVGASDRPQLASSLEAAFDIEIDETERPIGLSAEATIAELIEALRSDSSGRSVVVCAHGGQLTAWPVVSSR